MHEHVFLRRKEHEQPDGINNQKGGNTDRSLALHTKAFRKNHRNKIRR